MRRRGIIGWILNSVIWKQIIIRPLFNILILFLALFHWNLWRAIIAITLVSRLILIKFTSPSNQMTHGMGDIQPKLSELQEKYKDDPNRQAEEIMKVLKKEWKSPLKWCLRLLIQIPIFAWLYWVIYCMASWQIEADWLYSFFYSFWNSFLPNWIDPSWNIINKNIITEFLWIDLLASKTTQNIILAAITAILMFLQMKLTTLVQPKQKPQKLPTWQNMPDPSKMMWWISWMFAIGMWFMVYFLQAAMWLYMVIITLFTICQYARQYRSLLHAKRLELNNKPTIIKG